MGVQPTPATRQEDAEEAWFPPLVGGMGAVPEEEVEYSASPPPMSSCGRYILHRVCRFDTLAGVAIKYGVEVLHQPTNRRISSLFFIFFTLIGLQV